MTSLLCKAQKAVPSTNMLMERLFVFFVNNVREREMAQRKSYLVRCLVGLIVVLVHSFSAAALETPVVVNQGVSNTDLSNVKQIVRTSSGRLYYFIGNGGHTSKWDGWIELAGSRDGTSWYQGRLLNPWYAGFDIGVAVDHQNVIHMITYDRNKHPYYQVFNTGESTKGDYSWEASELLESQKTADNGKCVIAVDGNGNPHLVYMLHESYKGTTYTTLTYANRVGGVWNKTLILPKENKINYSGKFDIAVGPDNIPYILMGSKILKGNANNANVFEAKELGVTGYSFVIHRNGDVRVAVASNGKYANYLHGHGSPWSNGWSMLESATVDSGGILLLSNDTPYLARLSSDGIWLQKNFEPPFLVSEQPSGVQWQSLTTRWSYYNHHSPGVIDFGTRSWSDAGGNLYWYAKYTTPTAADFSATPLRGVAPLLVSFSDKSQAEVGRTIASWEWDFNNDGIADDVYPYAAYRFENVGKYSVQLKVADSAGGTDTKLKQDFIEVLSDSDGDKVGDVLDNCPNDYNPLQNDLNSNGIGDSCEPPFNRLEKVIYLPRLRTLSAEEQRGEDVTDIMKDGLLDTGVTLSSKLNSAVSIQLNKDALYIKKLLLRLYVSGTAIQPDDIHIFVMSYNPDMTTSFGRGYSVYGNGWHDIDLTPLLYHMTGCGMVKFRIGSLNKDFKLSEITLTEKADSIEMTVSPEAIDFGSVEVTKRSIQNITVRNVGEDAFKVVKLHHPSLPFSVVSDDCSGKSIMKYGSCMVAISFSPENDAKYNDELVIDSTDADNSSKRISLKGMGTLVLHGVVKDVLTGRPLNNVSVEVTDSLKTMSATTDTSGMYAVSGVTQGGYTAKFHRADYVTKTIDGTIYPSQINNLDAQLVFNDASITGTVTDETGTPLSGVITTLVLSGIASKDPADRAFMCNNAEIGSLGLIAANDGNKYSCKTATTTTNTMWFRVRNPFGADPFTVLWNGIGALGDGTEYLAQSFKPTKSGKLTKVGFDMASGLGQYVKGKVYVMLKSSLGGDRGTYLAKSKEIDLSTITSGPTPWTDFVFPLPPDVVAGQEYFLEINGTYFEWSGSGGHLCMLYWSNTDAYPNGKMYLRKDGLWSQTSDVLAFHTEVDGVMDIMASPSTASSSMYGGNHVEVSASVGSSSIPLDQYSEGSDGYYGYNGDDLTGTVTVSEGLENHYDQNGWLKVNVSTYSPWDTSLVTDQFSLTFNRTLTTVTDANGVYSFTVLPEANYAITFDKATYVPETVSGYLQYGDKLSVNHVLSTAQPASIQGSVRYPGGVALPGVAVTVTDQLGRRSGLSDSQGNYLVSGIIPGNYTVTFEGPKLQTKSLSGFLSSGDSGVVNVIMEPAPVSLTIDSPKAGAAIYANPLVVTGSVTNADNVTVIIGNNYRTTSYSARIVNGVYSASVSLEAGETRIYVVAENNYKKYAEKTVNVTLAPYSLRTLGDMGNVTIMEITGNYDVKKPDGTVNVEPRQSVATEYFKAHGDVDFLVILSTFDYVMPDAGAQGFYSEVKNDVQGINRQLFDSSALFGSAGRLQGTVDLGNVTALAANPYGPKLDETLTVLGHEIGHRWGAHVRFRNPDGTLNSDLLGKDGSHWSYLLDSKGSLLYGNGWKENDDGTFTSVSKQSGYSPLDLYLMGMMPKEQVPPMLLIDNPAIDKNQMPHLGDRITGTVRTITIDDIIAAEGERIPDAATSPKKFNVGFVLLTRSGDNATSSVAAVEILRSAWAGRFAELTRGIGGVSGVMPNMTLQVASPADGATVTGPYVSVTGTVINSTGAETGIMVNGMPATVSGSQFNVNHVPLAEGANNIEIKATDANGLTSTVTRSVTAQPGHYLRIVPNIDSGTAPLNVSIRLDGSFSIDNPTLSFSGPVPLVLSPGVSPTEFSTSLIVEGTYTVTASAVGPDGEVYSDSAAVTVVSMQYMDALLQSKWSGMKAAMAASDITKALSFVSEPALNKYQPIYQALLAYLPEIAAGMRPIEYDYLRQDRAEYRIARTELINGQLVEITYYIYFSRDKDGFWKIDVM